jgi:hypothetical protein
MGEKDQFFGSIDGKESLRRGHVTGYHLLNKCDIKAFERDYLVVDFRNTKHVPFGFFTKSIERQGRRLRLLSPYKEHLSQAFARFFMRVGLPTDIPAFKK